jgi:hypothetical protein
MVGLKDRPWVDVKPAPRPPHINGRRGRVVPLLSPPPTDATPDFLAVLEKLQAILDALPDKIWERAEKEKWEPHHVYGELMHAGTISTSHPLPSSSSSSSSAAAAARQAHLPSPATSKTPYDICLELVSRSADEDRLQILARASTLQTAALAGTVLSFARGKLIPGSGYPSNHEINACMESPVIRGSRQPWYVGAVLPSPIARVIPRLRDAIFGKDVGVEEDDDDDEDISRGAGGGGKGGSGGGGRGSRGRDDVDEDDEEDDIFPTTKKRKTATMTAVAAGAPSSSSSSSAPPPHAPAASPRTTAQNFDALKLRVAAAAAREAAAREARIRSAAEQAAKPSSPMNGAGVDELWRVPAEETERPKKRAEATGAAAAAASSSAAAAAAAPFRPTSASAPRRPPQTAAPTAPTAAPVRTSASVRVVGNVGAGARGSGDPSAAAALITLASLSSSAAASVAATAAAAGKGSRAATHLGPVEPPARLLMPLVSPSSFARERSPISDQQSVGGSTTGSASYPTWAASVMLARTSVLTLCQVVSEACEAAKAAAAAVEARAAAAPGDAAAATAGVTAASRRLLAADLLSRVREAHNVLGKVSVDLRALRQGGCELSEAASAIHETVFNAREILVLDAAAIVHEMGEAHLRKTLGDAVALLEHAEEGIFSPNDL